MNKTWRDIARPIIAETLAATDGMDERTIKNALYDAYPFGERQYHPYKVWLDEIKVQRKERRFGNKNNIVPKEQTKLF